MCFLLRQIAGACTHAPGELQNGLGKQARRLLDAALSGIDNDRLLDYHTHVVGTGVGETGNFVNPAMCTWRHPSRRIKLSLYLNASGVGDIDYADSQYVERLVDLVQNIEGHGKHGLLAFDKNYNPDGTVNLTKTEFYTSNDYVFSLAEKFPDLFLPIASVNPYRPDAIEELARCARRGARVVKWLPNAMGIDPSDPRCDPFYMKMKELDLVLLSHAGEEKAVESEEDQKLGNPLLLRRALDHSVKVIVAHCAGLGHNEDLDSPRKERRLNFDLFMRLMEESRYEGLLFADISAMTQFNRMGAALTTMLRRADLHHRLVNGSDYPLPAFNFLIQTRSLVKAGYISSQERLELNEIYNYNPLLFDYVLKRTIKAPGTEQRFAASVFMANPELGINS
jgi:predicted TIM-barrel fold metal-dependent hydrolase